MVSLDFELAWGVRDTLGVDGRYHANLLGAREAVPRILDLFEEFGIGATWAIVGFLFAESKDELLHYAPQLRPTYRDSRLDPYLDVLGEDEKSDPLRYAPSLVAEIASRPRQEVASHTFSHYYCLEEGQTLEQFAADAAAAAAIAAARGHSLKSVVFPRNQMRPDYLPVLAGAGFTAFRGAEPNGLNRPRAGLSGSTLIRALRMADVFVDLTGPGGLPWGEVALVGGLADVRSSRFLRPWRPEPALEALRWRRVASGMRAAADSRSLFHLWWHPHNFGVNLEQNLAALRRHLELHARLMAEHGFGSLTMAEVAERAAAGR